MKATKKVKENELEECFLGEYLTYLFKNGVMDQRYISDSSEYDRLWKNLQNCVTIPGFIVFDSEGKRIMLNTNQLSLYRFEWDPNFINKESTKADDNDEDYVVRLYISGLNKPLVIEVNPESSATDERDGMGQFSDLMYMLENSDGKDELLSFFDEKGDRVFFNVRDLMQIELPLYVFEEEPSEKN